MTKTEMARFVVMALYNMKKLPGPDHFQVKRKASLPVDILSDEVKLAQRALASVGRPSTPESYH